MDRRKEVRLFSPIFSIIYNIGNIENTTLV